MTYFILRCLNWCWWSWWWMINNTVENQRPLLWHISSILVFWCLNWYWWSRSWWWMITLLKIRGPFYDIFHPALLRSAGQQLQRLHNNLSPWLREWGGITITIIITITTHKPSTKSGHPSLKCPRPSHHCYHPRFVSIKRIVQISSIPHPTTPMLMLNVQGIIMICLAALGGLANAALMLLILVRFESPHNLPIFIVCD